MKNREIKFRAFNNYGMFYNIALFDSVKGLFCTDMLADVWHNDGVLMQYTGLKDMYDNEIYEGDILTDHKLIYVVEYNIQRSCYFNVAKRFTGNTDYSAGIYTAPLGDGYLKRRDLKIIGNIYENQELISG